jgi:hypothetical protein
MRLLRTPTRLAITSTVALALLAPAAAVTASAAPAPAVRASSVASAPTAVRAGGPVVSLAKGSDFAPGARVARFKTVNACTRDYYMIRSWMEHFEGVGGGTLSLAPGTYTIPSTIYVPSNTTIALSAGTTLLKTNRTCTKKFKAASSMFMLVPPSRGKSRGSVGGYGGASDIAIVGAGGGQSVIDLAGIRNSLGIIAGHNQRVRIEGIRFVNMNNNHFIEMDANLDSVIRGNEFLNATPNTRRSAEAVNLDTPDGLTDGFGSIWSTLDAPPNANVLVEGNTFANMQRGLGTHNFSGGQYHTGIVVRGNQFLNMTNDAIRIMNWRDSAVIGNTFDTVWCPSHGNNCRGILASGAENLTVRDNVFANMTRAMQFMPWANAGKAAVYGWTFNALTGTNLLDLAANVAGPGLVRPEAIINNVPNVWSDAQVVRFAGT